MPPVLFQPIKQSKALCLLKFLVGCAVRFPSEERTEAPDEDPYARREVEEPTGPPLILEAPLVAGPGKCIPYVQQLQCGTGALQKMIISCWLQHSDLST